MWRQSGVRSSSRIIQTFTFRRKGSWRMGRAANTKKSLCLSSTSRRTITTDGAVLGTHVARRAAAPAVMSQVCLYTPPIPACTHSGWRPSAGPWTRSISICRPLLITPVGSVDQINIKKKISSSVQHSLLTFVFRSTSIDRKVQRLEAEVQELEVENQSLQASLEELRISLRRLEQMETEKKSLEQEATVLERDKRQLEKENRRLRQQVGGLVFRERGVCC